ADGVNRIERMLAVGGEPIEMFGTVMNRMEPPKKADAVLKAMAPVDDQVTQEHNLDNLEPPGLRSHRLAKMLGNDPGEPMTELDQDPEYQAIPNQILAEEKAQIGEPGRAKEALPRFGGKYYLQGAKDEDQEKETEARGE